jgi:hypothetical protein
VKTLFLDISLLFVLSSTWAQLNGQNSGTIVPDGNYVALEKMPNISPDEPKAAWFHENTLVIRNNEAILDIVPVVFLNGKKEYSASDGAFMTFRGRFVTKDGVTLVILRMCRSDYLAVPLNHPQDRYKELKTYPVKLNAGRVEFAGVSYKIGNVNKPYNAEGYFVPNKLSTQAQNLGNLEVESAVIDGEIISLDSHGRSVFLTTCLKKRLRRYFMPSTCCG